MPAAKPAFPFLTLAAEAGQKMQRKSPGHVDRRSLHLSHPLARLGLGPRVFLGITSAAQHPPQSPAGTRTL